MLCKLQTTIQKLIITFIIIQLFAADSEYSIFCHDTIFTYEGVDWKFSFQSCKMTTI